MSSIPVSSKGNVDLFVTLRGENAQQLLPEITFDDGHVSNFEFALPILQSRNLRAWFFITVGWTGHKTRVHGLAGVARTPARPDRSSALMAGATLFSLIAMPPNSITNWPMQDSRWKTNSEPPSPQCLCRAADTISVSSTACHEAGYTQVFTSIPKAEPDPTAHTIGRLNVRGDMTLEWIANLFQPGSNLLSSLERQYHRKAAAKRLLGDQPLRKTLVDSQPKRIRTPKLENLAAREDSAHHQ